MALPSLYSISTGKSIQTAFGGLNETYGCAEAEFTEMKNFSSRGYPALQTRTPRRTMRAMGRCNGMYHLNGLLLCEGTTLRYTEDSEDDVATAAAGGEIVLENAVTDSEKIMIGMGTKILIWPDAKSFDTATGKLEALSAAWSQTGTVTIAPCDAGGKTYTVSSVGTTEPSGPADGTLFLKQNSSSSKWAYVNVLEQYDAKSGKWAEILLNSVKMTLPGLAAAGFKKGDTITVEQVPGLVEEYLAEGVNGEVTIEQMDGDSIVLTGSPKTESARYYGSFTVTAGGTTWKSMNGSESATAGGTTITARRRVPRLEYVTENANRVWGCNSEENVIYSCKLGDPTNWYSYRGIASDSYAVNVGSDGPFTGAATCMGYALFFKENTLHKLYGSKPSDFQLTSLRCRGVAKNAARSLCVLNETLYYLSPDGVMAWDGSIPTKVSGVLDSGRLSNVQSAVGGALDGRYYLHIARAAAGEGVARLLVYDTERALWSEEDVCSYEMTSTGGQLYLWDGQALWAADPSRETDWQSTDGVEEKLNFELVTGDIGLDDAEDRYLSRLTLRLDAECGSTVTVAASYDGGPWETVAELAAQNVRRSYDMPFVPRRHGTLRLRLKGRGQITLRSIAKTVAAAKGGITGGEV